MKNKSSLFPLHFLSHFLNIGLLFLVVSCDQATSFKQFSGDIRGVNQTPVPNATLTGTDNLYWFTTINTQNVLQINANRTSVAYLRGNSVTEFLTKEAVLPVSYCLVINFDLGSSSNVKQLRLRVSPLSFNNFSTVDGGITKALRVEFDSPILNKKICKGTVAFLDENSSAVSFDMSTVCPSCNDLFQSLNLSLYRLKGQGLGIDQNQRIAATDLDFSSMSLRIDPKNQTTDSSANCSDSNCHAQSFNCCIDHQCVNDGALRTNALAQPRYAEALQSILNNRENIVFFPEIFFVCPNRPYLFPTPTNYPDPQSTVTAESSQKISDYFCLLQGASGDYSSCSPNNAVGYQAVKNRTKVRCGCLNATAASADSPTQDSCQIFTLMALDISGKTLTGLNPNNPNDVAKIAKVTCDQQNSIPRSSVELFLNVPNRSAPHRFFKSDDGSEIFLDVENLQGTPAYSATATPIQEGDSFAYQDPSAKIGVITTNFNMNAILGPMNADLSAALPAVAVSVTPGKQYVVSALSSSTYTPCPDCLKDAWSDIFSAFPKSTFGKGNFPNAYLTTRESDPVNQSSGYGNYEDQNFGRSCFLPPTMIPFSHQAAAGGGNAQTQRLNRLKTQAALYANGYKRDWFGFNFGALIGSFNGVNWFAIGQGRIVTADSDTLYLAMNGPVADLAVSGNSTHVSVISNTINQAATTDYDPNRSLEDPLQTQAATCQRYHICNTDSDCIANLGWEYVCGDPTVSTTLWPSFGQKVETPNASISGRVSSLAVYNSGQSLNGKRCLYRGAGAPCKRDFATLNDETLIRALTCAPNFTCETLGANFNTQIAREPNPDTTFIYGQGSPRMARPKHYISDGTTSDTDWSKLPPEVVSNLKANADAWGITGLSSDFGICRPGKDLKLFGNGSVRLAHQRRDSLNRTDFINQIGGCNSSILGDAQTALKRLNQCPLLDDNGNYYYLQNTINNVPVLGTYDNIMTTSGSALTTNQVTRKLIAQNACGQESLTSDGGLSAFSLIESLPLNQTNDISQETLVRDGCLRRAGSVCHTDLDCSPNRLHESTASAGNNDVSYFGFTAAEQEYWQQSLICSHGKDLNAIGSSAQFYGYQLNTNRCCRDVGLDFTMHTENDIFNLNYADNSFLKTDPASFSINDPRAVGRYSRYSILSDMVTQSTAGAIATPSPILYVPVATQPKIVPSPTPLYPEPFQWKAINDTGNLTCCGGGWVRKFTNGQTWPNKDALQIPLESLKCINYRTTLTDATPPNIIFSDTLAQNEALMCRDTFFQGCASVDIPGHANLAVLPPSCYPNSALMTLYEGKDLQGTALFNSTGNIWSIVTASRRTEADFAPYVPQVVVDKNLFGDPTNYYATKSSDRPYMDASEYMIILQLPSYVDGLANIDSIYAVGFDPSQTTNSTSADGTAQVSEFNITLDKYHVFPIDPVPSTGRDCSNIATSGPPSEFQNGNLTDGWCFDSTTGRLYVKNGNSTINSPPHPGDSETAMGKYPARAVMINFHPMGMSNCSGTLSTGWASTHSYGSGTSFVGATPGNDLYYLKKLERLELIGVPQMTYEPIFCNNDINALVPGFFAFGDTRAAFDAAPAIIPSARHTNSGFLINDPAMNPLSKAFFQDQLSSRFTENPIFESNKFTCCVRLGETTLDPTKCCSGFGKQVAAASGSGGAAATPGASTATQYTCKLPNFTDVHLYFNKFISGEGTNLPLVNPTNNPAATPIPDPGQLVDTDFDPYTGYPKLSDDVSAKVLKLAQTHCDSGQAFSGAAFGRFFPRPDSAGFTYTPSGNPPYGITYNHMNDAYDPKSTDPTEGLKGRQRFKEGRRWNHHLYCGNAK